MTMHQVIHGDSLDVLRQMDDNSIDAIVTDPPAGIAFMGKEWDRDKGGRDQWIAWMAEVATECLRVIKPGGHALVWAIPRTSHWTGMAWEQAGWEPRDKVYHAFGSGFPKSLDVSKAIDKAAGAEREVVDRGTKGMRVESTWGGQNAKGVFRPNADGYDITAPATPEAQQWDGWGTALKPAVEEWWLFRKPLVGTVAANVLAHGTGGLNIDACRVGDEVVGRWPANLVHDGSEEVVERFPLTGPSSGGGGICKTALGIMNDDSWKPKATIMSGYADSGSAARFFYCAKASRRERDAGLSDSRNHHATVKPIALMEWLIKLVTPPGGVVLDPFAGSGTTGCAAARLGVRSILVEREAEYVEIARRRVSYWDAELDAAAD